MYRMSLNILIVLSVLAIYPSTSRSQDHSTVEMRRNRLPTVISTRSFVVLRRARLLVRNRSRDELKLTRDQATRIDTLLADWSERVVALNQTPLGSGPGESGLTRSASIRRKNEARTRESQKVLQGIREILTPQQHDRLNQLLLQQLGVNAVFVREPAITVQYLTTLAYID